MPKHTFYDLKPQKKAIVFQAAVKEFAVYSFDESNISRIVKAADIARGSFYQYFEDKGDLYLYVLEEIGKAKREFIEPALVRVEELNLFEYCKAVFERSILFAEGFPDYHAIGELLIKRPSTEIKKRFIQYASDSKDEGIYKRAVEAAIGRGELRKDIHAAALVMLLEQLSFSVMDNVAKELGYKELKKIQAVYEEMLNIIHKGCIRSTEN